MADAGKSKNNMFIPQWGGHNAFQVTSDLVEKIHLTVKLLKIFDIYFCYLATIEKNSYYSFIICNGAPNDVPSGSSERSS